MIEGEHVVLGEVLSARNIVDAMGQSIERLERYWPPSKRGSRCQSALDELKLKRDAAKLCLDDALKVLDP